MVLVNTAQFSENDLAIFIESLEQISRIERLRRQRKEKGRPQHLEEKLNRLQLKIESNPVLISNETEEEMSFMESTYQQHFHDNSTYIMDDQYYVVDSREDYSKDEYDSLTCYSSLYSSPVNSCSTSTKSDECSYETLKAFEFQYLKDDQEVKRNKAKRKLSFLGFVRKKYKKCFSSSSNSSNWHKSDSWTKLTLV